ncbi:hypothetical protein ZIOFF_068491 [Zingiber officinale]|uniref:J domain-containing protein n=1 Tax=Zingiber officinale TaxID=94328 RepID=A0A8J5BLV0_ZINOF|nr:hypothetical protein ZIOFF_068491 [Zingiber officinale]
MAGKEDKTGDFYEVLGLRKECSEAELKGAYKKLAMKWHPDKCSASGNTQSMEEAKEKFQEIHTAYSVLSDTNKRFLYDVGVYDKDDHNDEKGMGDFLGEITQIMNQTKHVVRQFRSVSSSNYIPFEEGDHDSFEKLQQMFVEMFQGDLDSGFCGPWTCSTNDHSRSSSGPQFGNGGGNGGNKRGNSDINSGKANLDGLEYAGSSFSVGLSDGGQSSKGKGTFNHNNSKRRTGRKQKVSAKHDFSSRC